MDTIYWKKFTSDTFNPVYVVLVTADFPISLVADTLFLPFVLAGRDQSKEDISVP